MKLLNFENFLVKIEGLFVRKSSMNMRGMSGLYDYFSFEF